MKSKTILGADGATKMRQITVGIHGKGGEAGIKAIQQLAGMVDSLKQRVINRNPNVALAVQPYAKTV